MQEAKEGETLADSKEDPFASDVSLSHVFAQPLFTSEKQPGKARA